MKVSRWLVILIVASALLVTLNAYGSTVQLPKTGKTTSFAARDDGALQRGVAWPTPRFTDNGNGTIADNLTGLIWLKNANCFNQINWQNSIAATNTLANGACGLADGSAPGDWRIPNRKELKSLINREQNASLSSWLNSQNFTNVIPGLYWSSTTNAGITASAWQVYMGAGDVSSNSKGSNGYVWPVRGGQLSLDSLIISGISPFATRLLGTTSAPQQIILTNNSTSAFTIASTSIAGANTPDFSIASGGSQPCNGLAPILAANTSCTMQVTFAPSSSGVKSANLTINANGRSLDVPIMGSAFSTIQGTVTDLPAGSPLTGASITIVGGSTTTTDNAGKFIFAPAPIYGTYTVSINKTGYQPRIISNVVLDSNHSPNLDVKLPLSLIGTVIDSNSSPVAGATIVTNTGKTTQTDSQGKYVIGDLPVGTYQITFSKTNYFNALKSSVSVTDGESTTLNVVLQLGKYSTSQVFTQKGADSFAGVYEYDDLTIADNTEITSSGISQLVIHVNGTLTLGKNAAIRVRNGKYPNVPTNSIALLNNSNLNTSGNEVTNKPYRLYPDTFGRGGNGANGSDGPTPYGSWINYGCAGNYYVYSGGPGGGGGGGGFGGGLGGGGGSGTGQNIGTNHSQTCSLNLYSWGSGGKGADNGGTGGAGGNANTNAPQSNNGANGVSVATALTNIAAGLGDGNGGSSAGGGYGGGILTIIADSIIYDNENPPHFLVSGQKGGGENGEGGLVIIQANNYSPATTHWSLDSTTFGTHTYPSTNGGHGIQIGNPQKVFINSSEILLDKNISGTIRDMSTGNLIPNAIITASNGQTAQADANGAYSLLMTTPGSFTFTFSKAGFQSRIVAGVTVDLTKVTALDTELAVVGSYLNVVTATLPAPEIGIAYGGRIRVSGGIWPYSYIKAYGSLPPGLALDPSLGSLIGSPTTAGSYTFAIGVTDNSGTYAEKEYTVTVTAPLAISSELFPRITKNTPYNLSLQASGGSAPYTFQITAGSLPNGLTLNSNGTISGTTSNYLVQGNCTQYGWVCSSDGSQCAFVCTSSNDHGVEVAGDYNITLKITDSSSRINNKPITLSVDNPLAHTTTRLNDVITGISFSQALAATGGFGAYNWNIFSGQLPTGLSLNSTTGVISGTATSAISKQLVFSVQDAVGRVSYKQFTMNALSPLQIKTTAMPNAHVGSAYSEKILTNGGIGPYTFSYTGLVPNGLTLNSTTGVISGTPTSAGYVNLGITVTDSTYPTPQSVTQALGVRTTSQLTITNSSILPTARQSVAMNPVTLSAAGGSSPYTWSIVDGALPAGLTFNTATGTITGTPIGNGDFIFTVRVADSADNVTGGSAANPDKQFFIHISAPLGVITSLLPAAGVGIPFVAELQADGGQRLYSWSVVTGTLPAGLTLSADGVVSGTPTAKITSTVTFKVTDSDNPAQSAEKVLTFKVFDSLTIQETSLPQARAEQAYTTSLHAWLGVTPYSWRVSSGNLPPGITLLQNAGVATLQGTPTTAGSYTFTIEATDSGTSQQVATTEFTITVLSVFAITTPANLKSAVRTVVYSTSIAASGGAPSYSFAIVSGKLPDGLSLNPSTGAISGITTDPAGQSSSFTVRVTDSGTPTAYLDKEFSIFAIDQLTITSKTLPVVVQQSPYSATLTATGGVTPYSWTVSGGNLPAGVTLDPATGTLSGTPSVCGSFSFTAQLADSTTLPTTAQKPLAMDITCMNGACGTSNTKSFSAAPTNNFCTAGTPSALSGAGPWTWTCQGLNGGTSANCSANVLLIPGDSDGDGSVSIAEVQSAINMFLGLNNVAGYVDTDGTGAVSIAEVQKVINGFLGL